MKHWRNDIDMHFALAAVGRFAKSTPILPCLLLVFAYSIGLNYRMPFNWPRQFMKAAIPCLPMIETSVMALS